MLNVIRGMSDEMLPDGGGLGAGNAGRFLDSGPLQSQAGAPSRSDCPSLIQVNEFARQATILSVNVRTRLRRFHNKKVSL